MDKTVFMVENTDRSRSDTYTLRVCAIKPEPRKQYVERSPNMQLGNLVSFHEGILAGIPNCFELVFHEFKLSGIHIYYPETLTEKDSEFGVHVSGMQISVTVKRRPDQRSRIGMRMGMGMGNLRETKEEKMCRGSTDGVQGPITKYTNFYSCNKSSNDSTFLDSVDSVDELKIDITVSQLTKLQFTACGTNSTADEEVISKIERPRMKISEYYLSTSLSDVSIKCGAEIFPAHIFVLSANSEVFEKMFELDMKEAMEKSVKIKDSDANVVRELLRYFYTEKVENLENIGLKLCELADNYMVEGLKAICAHYLANHVSIENVLEMYCFGQKYGIQLLRDAAKQFLVKNKKNIVKDHAHFKAFMSAVPELLVTDVYNTLIFGTSSLLE